ncbi:hypothetical protein [Lysinibacillus sp. BSL11]
MKKEISLLYDYGKIIKYFKNALYLDMDDKLTMKSYTRIYVKDLNKKELNEILKTIQNSFHRSISIQTYVNSIIATVMALTAIVIAIIIPIAVIFLTDMLSADKDIDMEKDVFDKIDNLVKYLACISIVYIFGVGISGIISIMKYFKAQKLYKIIKIIRNFK